MRPIEFRGKSTAYNDWVYGDLLQNKNPFVGIRIFEVDGFNLEVDPDTVGQWTGLYDKNGVKIFEGDIVVCSSGGSVVTPIYQNGIYMAYLVEHLHRKIKEPMTQFNVIWRNGCEVIGNIHDNPNLLGGGA